MRRPLTALSCALVLGVAACGSSSPTAGGPGGAAPPKVGALASLGAGEGQVNLVAWAGYVENGSDDKSVDWVTPFAQQTGCKVNVKVAGTSDEMVTLMKSGDYD